MVEKLNLVADIGGTNARFAFATDQSPYLKRSQTLKCADFSNIDQALDAYLHEQQIEIIDSLCFAIAAPVHEGEIRFTNNHWVINQGRLERKFKVPHFKMINDFEAIAYSLSQLGPTDVVNIGKQESSDAELFNHDEDFTVAVLGPGTGLGAAALCQRDAKLLPLPTEGGHIGFSPMNKLQSEIQAVIKQKYGRVYNELLISGQGLVNIYHALSQINGVDEDDLTAADVATMGAAGSDKTCDQSLQLFFEILGQVAGDVVLALGAFDGVFIGGGICQRYPTELANSKFRVGFEAKAKQQELMQTIPSWLIVHKDPGLLGASVYARSLLS